MVEWSWKLLKSTRILGYYKVKLDDVSRGGGGVCGGDGGLVDQIVCRAPGCVCGGGGHCLFEGRYPLPIANYRPCFLALSAHQFL